MLGKPVAEAIEARIRAAVPELIETQSALTRTMTLGRRDTAVGTWVVEAEGSEGLPPDPSPRVAKACSETTTDRLR